MLTEINYLAVLTATVAALIASSAYYAVLGTQAGETRPWQIAVELLRSATLSLVLAGLVTHFGLRFGPALILALVLWTGFPAVLLSGSVLWEKVAWRIAAGHAGDWLLKLLLLTTIVSLWR